VVLLVLLFSTFIQSRSILSLKCYKQSAYKGTSDLISVESETGSISYLKNVAKDAYLGQIFTSATTVKNGLFYFLKQWSSDNTGFCEDGGVCSVIGKYSVGKNEAISYCSSHLNSIHHPHFFNGFFTGRYVV